MGRDTLFEKEDDDDDDDDDDGWITPGNIDQAKNSMNGVLETVQLEVACLTTDFAMQVVNGFIKKLFQTIVLDIW